MNAGQSRQWLAAAAIIFLTLLAYQPIWHAGFIWDDDVYVTENRTLRSVDGLRRIWTKPATNAQYYPLVFTSFWAEYHLWHLQPLGYHLVNVLLHALNALLLWRLLRRLQVPAAWLAAAVFALHPVMVESAAWITERKNVLSSLFYLLASLAFLRFRPLTDANTERQWDWRFYPLLLTAFLCALFSKTVTCTLPAALLLLVWWKTGRIEKRDVLALAPLFVLGAAMGRVTLHMEQRAGAIGAEWALSFLQRCLLAGRALWFYAGKLFWPVDLTFVYPRWNIDTDAPSQYLFPLAALAVVVVLWNLRSRLGRGPLVAVLFFAGTLAPALGFFDVYPFRFSYVADHFQYLASIGLIAVAVSAGSLICRRIAAQTRPLAILAGAALLTLLGSATWRQAHVYQDLETLWRDTLAKNPTCWMAQSNLGKLLLRAGKFDEALVRLDQALRLTPGTPAEPEYDLGTGLLHAGKINDATRHLQRALQLNPDYAEAHNNLGDALLQAGQVEPAVAHLREALRLKPASAPVHNDLGNALSQAGQADEAISEFQQALRLAPDYADAHVNLGNAFFRKGNAPDAIAEYELALRTKPRLAEAHNNFGVALMQLGRVQDAVDHYTKAIRIKPDYAEAHYNLASALSQIWQGGESIGEYEQALRLKPDYLEAHRDLALALEKTGKTTDAIAHYEQALRLQPNRPDVENNLAWLLATLPPAAGADPARAVTLAEHACQLTGHRVMPYLDTLAVAYAAVGQFDRAVTTMESAIALAKSDGQTQLLGELNGRLELFRHGHAYQPSTNPPASVRQ